MDNGLWYAVSGLFFLEHQIYLNDLSVGWCCNGYVPDSLGKVYLFIDHLISKSDYLTCLTDTLVVA